MNKKGLIIGATGLVGKQLTKQLLADDNYSEVHIFVRRLLSLDHNEDLKNKITQHIVDFDNIENWQDKLVGDELFCCLGTTLKQAGSKENQTQIDLNIPSKVATYAHHNGVKKAVLVSSTGANEQSSSFYLKLKGQLEQNFIHLDWEQVIIVRPSFLKGKRNQFRLGEELGIGLFRILKFVPFVKRYRPITGKQLAKTMRKLVCQNNPERVVIKELEQLFND